MHHNNQLFHAVLKSSCCTLTLSDCKRSHTGFHKESPLLDLSLATENTDLRHPHTEPGEHTNEGEVGQTWNRMR